MPWSLPNQVELTAARVIVGKHHPRTPLYRLESWDATGEIYVKYENHGPVRSFKARGGLYSLWRLGPEERTRGVVTASTGNHGRGIAYAGAIFGIPVTVVVPNSAPTVKKQPIERLGAQLRVVDGDLQTAQLAARAIAAQTGVLYLEDGEDPGLMAGASTVAAEILDDLPDVDRIVVPVGGGNLIAGIALLAKHVAPRIRIVGVQSEAAPAVTRSFQAGAVTTAPCETFAGGLATHRPGHLAFGVINQLVDDMLLVSEEDLRRQILRILKSIGEIAEGAGAAPFAALEVHGREWTGKTVLVLTGGNIAFEDLRRLIVAEGAADRSTRPKGGRPLDEMRSSVYRGDGTFEELIKDVFTQTGASRVTLRLRHKTEPFPVFIEVRRDDIAATGDYAADTNAGTFRYLESELRPLVQTDTRTAEENAPPPTLIEKYGVGAQILAPIVVDGALSGIISVHHVGGPREWSPQEIEATTRGAETIAQTLRQT